MRFYILLGLSFDCHSKVLFIGQSICYNSIISSVANDNMFG